MLKGRCELARERPLSGKCRGSSDLRRPFYARTLARGRVRDADAKRRNPAGPRRGREVALPYMWFNALFICPYPVCDISGNGY
jgi:hypothetical protein